MNRALICACSLQVPLQGPGMSAYVSAHCMPHLLCPYHHVQSAMFIGQHTLLQHPIELVVCRC